MQRLGDFPVWRIQSDHHSIVNAVPGDVALRQIHKEVEAVVWAARRMRAIADGTGVERDDSGERYDGGESVFNCCLIIPFVVFFFFLLSECEQIYGGTGYPFGETCSNKTFIYQPYKSPKIIEKLSSTGDMPIPQYGQSMLVRGPHIYVVGGTTGFEYSCDVHR